MIFCQDFKQMCLYLHLCVCVHILYLVLKVTLLIVWKHVMLNDLHLKDAAV